MANLKSSPDLVVTNTVRLAHAIGILGPLLGSSYKLCHRAEGDRFGKNRDRFGNNRDRLGNNSNWCGNSHRSLAANCPGDTFVDGFADRLGNSVTFLDWGVDCNTSESILAGGDRSCDTLGLWNLAVDCFAISFWLQPADLLVHTFGEILAHGPGDIRAVRLCDALWNINTDRLGHTDRPWHSNTVVHINTLGDSPTLGY